jgi:hypothetical protein
MLRALLLLGLIVVVGAVVLAPVMMMMDLDPMVGDFTVVLDGRHYTVPLLWSLCASSVLGLLYWIVKR